MTKIRIANSEIEIGKKYVLDHRFDSKAPSMLQKIGATKFPFEGNDNVERIWFDENANRYDTGFDTNSPCLRLVKEDKERDELVKQYVKLIKKPYEDLYNVNLSPTHDNDFWREYKMTAYVNRQFDTENKKDLMELFHLLYSGVVCEKDEKDLTLKANAKFTLTSNEGLKSKAKDKVKVKFETSILFSTLVNGDREKLDLILQWIDRDDPSKIKGEDLSLIYYDIINGEGGVNFCERFTKAYEEYDTPIGKEKMEWFYAIRKLYNKRKIKHTKRGYVADGDEFLGNTLQNIAEFCLSDKNIQHNIIKELIQENPDIRKEVPEHLKPSKA